MRHSQMGNTLGNRKTTKIMKINGETIKLKTPVKAGEVLKDYPTHALLESEMVKHFGIRAKPLEAWHELKAKRLYFLVELPKFVEDRAPRRAHSGINMSANDRLESLMLARRSVSDLSLMKPTNFLVEGSGRREGRDGMRVRMRLPKSKVTRVMMESKDENEAAEKIIAIFKAGNGGDASGSGASVKGGNNDMSPHQCLHLKSWNGKLGKDMGLKPRQKRVKFMPVMEAEIQQAAS